MARPGECTVQLLDGRQVSNYSEEWRRECYERELAALEISRLPDKDSRRRRVEAVRASAGDVAAERLVQRLVVLRKRIDGAAGQGGARR